MAKEKRIFIPLVTALLLAAIACQSTPQAPKESEPKTSEPLPGRGVSVR